MNTDMLSDNAISQALKSNWVEAIKINKQILKDDPNDIEALNRLARAYFEVKDLINARKTSLKTLKIDPVNNIATKAISKYKVFRNGISNIYKNINFSDFIEESGTTKQTMLLNLCSDDLISSLSSGDELDLLTHSHKVSVITKNKKYIGKLPDDLSATIRLTTKKGYLYKIIVKSADRQCVKIIIKEVNLLNQPFFLI